MYQRILVATDDSKLSKKAEKAAIELAGSLEAELVVLHVVPNYPMSYFEGSIPVSAKDIAKAEKGWSDKGQAMVDAVAAAATKRGVQARGVLGRSDRVADAVVAAAKKHKCDLIVMASHGRRGVARVLLGSETQHVLTHSTIPVLVLR
jgi:nucleotide-binding universal stress UspA family protein